MHGYDHFSLGLGDHGHGHAKRPAYVGPMTLVRAPAGRWDGMFAAKPTAARLPPLHLASG
jgi:hypothetical protein